ncbi:MAG: 3-phosphoshikimate 1-carboxyvinyltransferase [Candidatus Micrarchaeia archaeon]|jgi:3-phosphoshikimate 1-carboxyvinyltransferase
MNAIVFPQAKPLAGGIVPPSSKNYSARLLLATALLAEGKSVLRFPAQSDDFNAMLRCCKALGARITKQGNALIVYGMGGSLQQPKKALDVGNAGTVLRLLLGVCSVLPKVSFTTTYWDSLGTRPNKDLLDALAQLGVKSQSREGKLPITLYGGPGKLHGGMVTVSGEVSSQYVSSLLFLSPLVEGGLEIRVSGDNIKSKPAIRTTLDVLKRCGVAVQANKALSVFKTSAGQTARPGAYGVPGDFPSASYVLCAGAVVPSHVKVTRLFKSEQGEAAIIPVLQKMGANLKYDEKTGVAEIRGGTPLRAIGFDGDRATDAVLAMVAASVFAKGTSRFYNVENLRYKECDRIYDFCAELKKAGANVEPKPTEIIVHGTPNGIAGGNTVDAHNDHRIIMALSICALRAELPITIRGVEHVAKSYPGFFRDLKKLGAKIALK